MEWIARQIWGGMLRFMRIRPIKRQRLRFTDYLPEPKRARARASFIAQEKWARKNGLNVMRWTVRIFTFVISLQLFAALVYDMQARNMLSPVLP
jgi:hypothetical protein